MSWPTPQDYNEAIQHPRLNFTDAELRGGAPEVTPLGLPRAITGGFASVYQLRCGGRDWAVRCFLREVPDQQERYAAIGRALAAAKLPYTVGFAFLPDGIRIAGRLYPILKMEWVQGEPLDRWIERHLGEPAALRALAGEWVAMLEALRRAGVAHGDLQHGNVLVVNDAPRLIDYDGMFVPDLAGRRGTEVGHRNYQHPRRDEADFGPALDAFAGWSIYLSLRALSVEPALWQQLGAGDEHLLLRREDYERPATSAAMGALAALPDAELTALLAQFCDTLPHGTTPLPALHEILTRRTTQRRAAVRLVRRPAATVQGAAPASPAVSGAAAWLPDHLPAPQVRQLALSYTAERLLLGAFGIVAVGLVTAVALGTLAAATVAPTLAAICLATALGLALRFLGLVLRSAKREALLRLWRARLRVAAIEEGLRLLERGLAWLDRREARRIDALTAHWQVVLRQERAAFAALDRSLGRFADGRQGLDRAEEEEIARTLRERRQRLLAGELAGHTILSSGIPGIGPQAKLHLLTAGIRNAAQIMDVRVVTRQGGGANTSAEAVQIDVPGRGLVQVESIGRKKAQALLAWRRELEAQSQAALPDALPATEESAIRLRYHNRRRALDRQEAESRRRAERQKDGRRQGLRRRRASFNRRATALRASTARLRGPLAARCAALEVRIDAAHLALALARRDLAAYDEMRFSRYLKRIFLP